MSESEIAKVLSDTQILKVRGEKAAVVPSYMEEWSSDVVSYYEKLIERGRDVRERVFNDQGISPSPILSDLHYVLDNDLVDKLYEYAMFARGDQEELVLHGVEVTFTSLIIGKGMDYDVKMLLKLGLAAFLENVGMYRIPESIVKKRGSLNREEMRIIKGHPKSSYEILSQMGDRYLWLAEVAVQVHERSDGSGYPGGLTGEKIYELASIIGLVDMYVAMIRGRAHRERFIQTDAIKFIIEEGKGLFPSKIRKVFLNEISLFPVNTCVRLNNKSIGRVLSTDRNQPLRPTVELIYDSGGDKMGKREIIQLSENPLLYITGSIGEEELT
jgi:HD-GYP domain-containing protein (c-di-GMP phosphodiesterase class II)